MSTTEGELDVEVSNEREEGEVRNQLFRYEFLCSFFKEFANHFEFLLLNLYP